MSFHFVCRNRTRGPRSASLQNHQFRRSSWRAQAWHSPLSFIGSADRSCSQLTSSRSLGLGAMVVGFAFNLSARLRDAINNLPPHWREFVEAVDPISMRVDENGVSSVIDGRRMRSAWLDLLKVTVHDDVVLLWTMNSSCYVVPRGVFTDDQTLAEFVAIVTREIGDSRYGSMTNPSGA